MSWPLDVSNGELILIRDTFDGHQEMNEKKSDLSDATAGITPQNPMCSNQPSAARNVLRLKALGHGFNPQAPN